MTKRRRSPTGEESRQNAVVTALSEMEDHILADPSVNRDRRGDVRRSGLEDEAEHEQRAVFNRNQKKNGRAPADPDFETEEGELDHAALMNGEGEDDERLEDADDGDLEEGEDEELSPRRSQRVSRADEREAEQAMEENDAPGWMYDLPGWQKVSIADSYASHRAPAPSREDRREAAQDAPDSDRRAVQSRENVEKAAAHLATGLSLDGDATATSAIKAFGEAIRQGDADRIAGLESTVAALQNLALDSLLERAKAELGEEYPQLLDGSRGVLGRLKRKAIQLDAAGGYEGDPIRAFKDAAYLELGPPKKGRRRASDRGTPKRRGAGGPVTRTKKRSASRLVKGTDEHDRALYKKIRARSKAAGLTSGRR